MIDADTGQPTDELSPLARRMIGSLGSHCTSVSQVVHSKDHAVFTAIAQRMERVNQRFDSSEHKVCNSHRRRVYIGSFVLHNFIEAATYFCALCSLYLDCIRRNINWVDIYIHLKKYQLGGYLDTFRTFTE